MTKGDRLLEQRRQRAAQSEQMLREVLAGDACQAVAVRHGLATATVDRRIKSLVRQLVDHVGVVGLRSDGVSQVGRLRSSKAAILAALDRYKPRLACSTRSARVITVAEVEHGAARVQSRSEHPQLALALYFLPFATGLWPLEVARLQIRDYLREDGAVRRESVLRAEAAINGRARPLIFGHRRLDEALAACLEARRQAGHGLGADTGWRGLDPASPLLLAPDGQPYAITPNGGPGQNRFVCRPLLALYRRIFRHAGVVGLCAHSARLTLMSRMYERGAYEDQIGLVLGIAEPSAVRGLLPRPRRALVSLLEEPV